MVFFRAPVKLAENLSAFLKGRGILVSPGAVTRLVTHLDIRADDIRTVLAAFDEYFGDAGA
jgi:threonine aldolase